MRRELVAVGDCQVDVRRFGHGDPVVVLPGEYGVLFADRFIEALGRSHEVIVPLHPGWGRSSRPRYVRTARDVALVQQEVIERLRRPVPVIGLSFGGWIAAEVAAGAPSLVSHLVLISPTGVKVGGREDRDFRDIFLTEPGDRRGVFYAEGRTPPIAEIEGADVYLEIAKSEDAVARYCWSPYMHDPGLRYRLRRVTARTLVISGGRDRLVLNPRYFEMYASWLGSGAEHRRLDSAGHRVEEEEPEIVAEAILSFARKSAATTAGH